jgi:hypothetical protein
MINPSAGGWIDKFFSKYSLQEITLNSSKDFYCQTRLTGFIYGHVIRIDSDENLTTIGWTSEEISKVALLNSLYGVFKLETKDSDSLTFIEKTVAFYNQLNPQGFSFFKKLLPNESNSKKLEKIINERVQTNDNLVSKNFSHIVTNALLFVDVLAFQNYLLKGELSKNYIQKIEELILGIVSLALKTKLHKTHYDDLLIKLFETSVRYTKFSGTPITSLDKLPLEIIQTNLEKYYIMDLAGMAIWSDGQMEEVETEFLHELGKSLALEKFYILESLIAIDSFITTYKAEIPYFNYSNPIKHFYEQSTQTVVNLIRRNKKRLQKELAESRELVVLLAYSTQRELDEAEKKKMKRQLLDICKTIPSLTIFLLPGGSLLLPILIKFIPQILPSSFNENLDS